MRIHDKDCGGCSGKRLGVPSSPGIIIACGVPERAVLLDLFNELRKRAGLLTGGRALCCAVDLQTNKNTRGDAAGHEGSEPPRGSNVCRDG